MNLESKKSIASAISRRRAGFTLIEMLIVLAMIGLVATLAIGNLGGLFGDAKVKTAENWVNGTGKAYVEAYNVKHGNYPVSLNDLLAAKDGQTPVVTKKKDITDPWGNLYQYQYPSQHNVGSFDLWAVHEAKTIGNWDAK